MRSSVLRLGTRGSPLALAQAAEVKRRLAAAHPDLADPSAIETVTIRTSGDKLTDRTLAAAGGKGLFTKEIEEALLQGGIDLAVHSMKDMATVLPDGLAIAAHLPRQDPRDAFISPKASSIAALPQGAILGTAALRRQAQVLRLRPDLTIVPLRGNVETRLRKLEDGKIDAILLALAGLKRLGLAERATAILDEETILPAVAQGAIGIECRITDDRTRRYVAALDDAATSHCITAERAFLAALDGSCRTPIAGLARLDGVTLRFRGLVIRPDGRDCHRIERQGSAADAAVLGHDAGSTLRATAGPDFFDLPAPADAAW